MDDTTATTPAAAASTASAAAVAESASNKLAVGGDSAAKVNVGASVNSNNVKLLIKSSNQQYDDLLVESELSWTVMRLKKQLSVVYPGKPPIVDQKLIYSGKLLQDKQKLIDVIRSYKDVYTQNHIFHLVCVSKNAPITTTTTKTLKANNYTQTSANVAANIEAMSSNAAATSAAATNVTATADGLRQRHVAGGTQQQQQQYQQLSPQQHQQQQQQQSTALLAQQQQQWNQLIALTDRSRAAVASAIASNGAATGTATTPLAAGVGAVTSEPYALQQQMQTYMAQQTLLYNAWVQQAYAQYMQQYTENTNATVPTHSLAPNQFMPFMAASNVAAAAAAAQLPVISPYFAGYAPQPQPAAPANQQPTANPAQSVNNWPQQQLPPQGVPAPQFRYVPDEPEPQQEQQEQLHRRFPQIQEDDADNRDWLDNFFALTRLGIFLMILYFNSSPLRCLLVVLIASGIYLYHIGVLRRHRERNNNNIRRNNNADAVAENAVQELQRIMDAEQRQQQPQPAAAPAANINPPNTNAAQPLVADNENAANADAADGIDAAEPRPNAAAAAAAGGAGDINGMSAGAATAAVAEQANSTSVLSLIRTFVVTFFTSLLPEAPAL